MIGPTNAEFFRFLEQELSFSLFRRSGETLVSFKETIEFVLLPEATAEGPEEGLLFEGTASLSSADWQDLIARFVMTTVETRIDPARGTVTRVFRATKQLGDPVPLTLDTHSTAAPGLERLETQHAEAGIREELHAEGWRYVWTGPHWERSSPGRLTVHARKIACRGTDKGMPAGVIFREKLRRYRLQRADR
jgi:hypothetical protein